jgi:hypothetical protein
MNEVEDFLSDEPIKLVKNEIIIDPEIKERLWKLDSEEYENLKQSLIKEGCRDALVLWNNILIDGHNRYEICKAFDVPYKSISKNFNNKNEVLKWIDKNQLCRRNLLDWQRTILLGRLSRVNKVEGFKGNQFEVSDKMSQSKIATDLGITTKTLQRAEKFTDAYEDIIKKYGIENANEIAKTMSKQDVVK